MKADVLAGGEKSTAFTDGFLKKFARKRGSHERADGERTGRFAADGDVVGITAESRDILDHPFESGHLIEERVVARGMVSGFLGQFRMRVESEDAETIVGLDDDDAFSCKVFAVVARLRVGAGHKSTAVIPEEDGQFGVRGVGGNPNVQIEAILARLIVAKIDVAKNVGLQTG